MNNRTIFAEFIKDFVIEIPRIQRDYVQGRAITSEQIEKRNDFVSSMISALESESEICALDFVYGFTTGNEQQKTFIPLDGQQRLTSLYLLHWYLLFLLKRKTLADTNIEEYDTNSNKINLLNGRFTYNNRTSSTEFCKRLTSFENDSFNFNVEGKIKDVLIEQAWFDDEWLYDPTIETMLEMLGIYEGKLSIKSYDELKKMTERLFTEEAIFFDKLNLEELHQGESLYVKMNARGKKLTQFENWKSKFTKMLETCHGNEEFDCGDITRCNSLKYKDYFCYSVEHEWNDIFWHFETKDMAWNNIDDVICSPYPTVDRSFSNFLKFIHIIFFFSVRNDKDAKIGNFQWTFAQNEESFGTGKTDNLKFLFQCLDFLSSIKDFETFFKEIFYTKDNNCDYVPSHKVRLYNDQINLFELAIGYDKKGQDIVNNREDPNKFDLTSNYLLWAILKYCAPKYCASRTSFAVDDTLRNYVRECRNNIEKIDEFRTDKVTLSQNIKITESCENLKKLPQTNVAIKYPTDKDLQDLYEWLGDFNYVGGQASAFVPILDDIKNGNSNITSDMIKNFMEEFDKATTLQKNQMFIGAGYIGKRKIGNTSNRERIFFGQKVRWNVLFVEDFAEVCKILRKLIVDYNSYKDISKLLEYYRQKSTNNTFAYYMLNYDYALWAPNNPADNLNNSENGDFYYAVLGNLDDMDMIALRNFTNHPLSAKHIDPLVCAVVNFCLKTHPNITNHIKFIGRYGTKHGIAIPETTNVESYEFHIVSNKDGWTIETDTVNLQNSIIKENPNLSYNNVFELTVNDVRETDKVIIGETILETIAKIYNW